MKLRASRIERMLAKVEDTLVPPSLPRWRHLGLYDFHPHMLRHGCGYALANAGHDTRALQAWLGHKNI
jgi:integrase